MYYKYSKLFKQDSLEKQIIIEYDGGVITNNELYSESFELTESLCSETNLKFGSCEASSVKFKIANVTKPLKGKWLTISMVIGGKTDEPFQIGKYKVYSDAPSADRNYRDVTAYDAMYDIINADITKFYNDSITNNLLPVGIIQGLLREFGIACKETISETPNWYVSSSSTAESLSGKDLINAFCELNGCFARIDRDGKFEFVKLGNINNSIYPSDSLFPSSSLFPTDKESASSGHGFDGYQIKDGYLYSKVWGKKILKSGNNATELYGVGYRDVYDIRIKIPSHSEKICILTGTGGLYIKKDDEEFYAPVFYWRDERFVEKTKTELSLNMTIEVDVDTDGSFSMSGVLFCKTYSTENDGGRYGIRNIPNIPVFDNEEYMRSYLSSGDLEGCVNYSGFNDIEKSEYISCKYEDFTVKNIESVLIRNSENEAGALAGKQGENSNCYIIEDNFLVHGKSYTELKEIAYNLYDSIRNITYVPYEAEVKGKPHLKPGERVRIKAKNKIIESYILKRTLKGIQALRDSYSADGEEYYDQNVNSVGKTVIQLKRKTNTLTRNLEETASEIYSLDEAGEKISKIKQNAENIELEASRAKENEEKLSSSIKQNAENIELKVTKGDVSAQLSVELEKVTIKGNRLTIESDNFKVDGTGKIEATGTLRSTDIDGRQAVLGSGELYYSTDNKEIGSIATAQVGDTDLGVTVNTAQKFISMGKGTSTSATGYYFLNLGLNPNGVTKRHYFEDSIYSTKYLFAERLYCDDLNGYIYGAGITESEARLKTSGNFSVHGDFVCGGTKNRAVKTKNYGTILMNAMESTGAYFTDIGSGKITEGVCYIYLDDKFMEVTDNAHEYQVFLTNTSRQKTEYVEKQNGYFIVHGEDEAAFDWIIVAKQKDYNNVRMEAGLEESEKEQIVEYDETVFDEDDMPSVQTQEYMKKFSDNIDDNAIAYVINMSEMEKEKFIS